MRSLLSYAKLHWKTLSFYGGVLLFACAMLGPKLGSLPGGYTLDEQSTYEASLHAKDWIQNPLNAPFLAVTKALHYLLPHSLISVRLAAAIFGAGALLLFAMLLRQWQGMRTAILGTLLFGTSAWFLHTARLGTPDVLLFGVLALVAGGSWLKHSGSSASVLVCFLLAATLLYVPGMVWFIVLGVVLQWKMINRIFKKHLALISLCGVLCIVLLAPLGWALYKHHDLIMSWLNLPAQWPALIDVAKNLLLVPFHLLVHNQTDPATWLGSAPILDVFSLVMFLLGCYLYAKQIRSSRVVLFLAIGLLTLILMAIGSDITFTVLMPFVYIVAATGIVWLLTQWFVVFPRNPIARVVGWIGIGLLVAIACAYQLTHYFVGWPEASATQQIFSVHRVE